ncbi:MAG: DUF4340 domain-containing protein [Bacteroidota bacterium]
MRTTLLLALLLIGSLTAYFAFLFNPDGDSFAPGDAAFAIEDTAQVYRIVLTQIVEGETKHQIELDQLPDGDWQLNGQYPAMVPRVRNLLGVMSRLEVRTVLNDAAEVNAERFFSTIRTEVQAFDAEGDLIKSYDVGSETPKSKGTLMRLKGQETPYVVELPGLAGYVKAAYSLDPSFWHANRLFDAQVNKLLRFSVLYREPERSFTLERLNDSTLALADPKKSADPQRLEAYLSLFKGRIYAETFAEAQFPGRKAKLEQLDPDLRVVASYRDGSERIITLHDREDNPNNLFGWVEGEGELLTIQHFVIDPFLVDRNHLLGIDPSQDSDLLMQKR